MAFNPMDFFQAGTSLGQSQKSPMAYGAENVHDIFNKMMENQMQLAQTAAIFKGQKEYEYGTDPTKLESAANYKAMSGGAPDTQATGAVPPGQPGQAGSGFVLKSKKGFGGTEYTNLDALKQEKMVQEEAQVKGKIIESGSKLGTAVKRLNLINNQLNKALPTGNNNPLTQRIAGPLAVAGAKSGLMPNPKLMALKKNIRPIGIQLIRAFGEVGNLSEQEQSSSMDVVSNESLTEDERLESLKQFAEFAIAGARPEAIDMMMQDPGVASIIKDLGINTGHSSSDGNGNDSGGGNEDDLVAQALAKNPQNKKAILALYKERNKGKEYGKR